MKTKKILMAFVLSLCMSVILGVTSAFAAVSGYEALWVWSSEPDNYSQTVFQFYVYNSTDHTGRIVNYQITSPSGSTVTSGTQALSLYNDFYDSNGNHIYAYETPILYYNFYNYLNGTYKITYKVTAGTASYTSSTNIYVKNNIASSSPR